MKPYLVTCENKNLHLHNLIVECQPGKFGYNCKNTCSVNCKDYNSCDKTSGNCAGGCLDGWQGNHCDRGTTVYQTFYIHLLSTIDCLY